MVCSALHMEHTDQLEALQPPEIGCRATLNHQPAHTLESFRPPIQIVWIPLKSSIILFPWVNAATTYMHEIQEDKTEPPSFRLVIGDFNFCFSAFYLCCSPYQPTWTLSQTGLLPEGSSSFIRGLLFLLSGLGSSSGLETHSPLSDFTAISNGIWEETLRHIFSSVHKLKRSSHLFSN